MANELQKLKTGQEVMQSGFGSVQGFDLIQRGAKLLAQSSLVPKEFQCNIPNCVVALNMANRLGADPLLVMQNLYVVYNRPAWSSKFLIASFNQCGKYTSIDYKWCGKEGTDSWGCRAYAKEKSTDKEIVGPLITIKIAKEEGWYNKNGSKWRTIPELMLRYRASGWLVNTYAPEISMGLNTVEELRDVINVTPQFNQTPKKNLEDIIDKEQTAKNLISQPKHPSTSDKSKRTKTQIEIHKIKKQLKEDWGDDGLELYYSALNKEGVEHITESNETQQKAIFQALQTILEGLQQTKSYKREINN